MSLDFRVSLLPYKSSSFATPEGEVCSMLTLDFILNQLHFGKTATFGCPLSGCAGLLHGKGNDITPQARRACQS